MKTIQIITLTCLFSLFVTHADAQDEFPFKSNVIRINAGYALTGTSKVNFSPWGKDYGSKNMGGSAIHFNYSHLWQRTDKTKSWGIGMEYQFINPTSKDYTVKSSGDIVKDKIKQYYIAPQFVLAYRLAKNLTTNINLGIGYMRYHNDGRKNDKSCETNGNGFGVNAGFDIEYRVTPNIGISAGAEATFGFIGKLNQTFEGKKETIDLNSDYDFNPSPANFTIGIRYYW